MLEKLEVILSANKFLNPLGYAVVDLQAYFTGFVLKTVNIQTN